MAELSSVKMGVADKAWCQTVPWPYAAHSPVTVISTVVIEAIHKQYSLCPGKPYRDSEAKSFTVGHSYWHPACSTSHDCEYSRLLKRKQVPSINHTWPAGRVHLRVASGQSGFISQSPRKPSKSQVSGG